MRFIFLKLALAILLVHETFAYKSVTIATSIAELTMKVIIEPVTFINITVGMDKSAFPNSHVICPISFEFSAILPKKEFST